MCETKQEVVDELEKQALKLSYLADSADIAGLSELLLDISSNIAIIKYAECLRFNEEDKDGKTD